jgi:hypothetical protein
MEFVIESVNGIDGLGRCNGLCECFLAYEVFERGYRLGYHGGHARANDDSISETQVGILATLLDETYEIPRQTLANQSRVWMRVEHDNACAAAKRNRIESLLRHDSQGEIPRLQHQTRDLHVAALAQAPMSGA